MDKKERLEAIIAHYGEGKPTGFAKALGIAPSTISTWLSRNTMDYDLLFAKCEGLSAEWLLTGVGQMLKTPMRTQEAPVMPADVMQNLMMQQAEHISALTETIRLQSETIKKQNEMIDQLQVDIREQATAATVTANTTAFVG